MRPAALKNDPTRELQDLADIQALVCLPGMDLDVVALRGLRKSAVLSQAEYFRFLSRLPPPRLTDMRAQGSTGRALPA